MTEEKYVGRVFKSSRDDSVCKIVQRLTFDTIPSKSRYLVVFNDGTKKEYNYGSLCSGHFSLDKQNSFIGKIFNSKKDNSKCRIIKQLTFDNTPSLCKYLVEFEDGEKREFTYRTLIRGNFKKCITKNYIGEIFTSKKDNSKCKIIKQLTFDKIPSVCSYLVVFEDGLEKEYNYNSLKRGDFSHIITVNEYIGKIFTSKKDNSKCKIIKQVSNEKQPSHRNYLVEFDDGSRKVISYITLQQGAFVRKQIDSDYIGKVFISKRDNSKCKIIKQISDNKSASKCKFLVEFEDGTRKEYFYSALQQGLFRKENRGLRQEFISNDGCSCKIIKQLTFDKKPSLSNYLVRFDNGYEKEFSYVTLKSGSFTSKPSEFFVSNAKVDEKYYMCECKLCGYRDVLTTTEMIKHLQENHNLYK